MAGYSHDKLIELERYDKRAAAVLAADQLSALGPDGAQGIPVALRTPYTCYQQHIIEHSHPNAKFLDLCCGNGQHSLAAARAGACVTAVDIAPANIVLTVARARRACLTIQGVVADSEKLPWLEPTFDVITCAGSLSYVDLEKLLPEILRVLRPGGAFIFVDSLNHNPIYRFNRWLHYLRGRRSFSTLQRMPTLSTLRRIQRDFPDLQVSYHGIFSFLAPLLAWAGPQRVGDWLDRLDRGVPWLRHYAFKIVGVGHKPGDRP